MHQIVVLEPNQLFREGLVRLLTESGYYVARAHNIADPDISVEHDESVDLVLTELPGLAYSVNEWIDRIQVFYPFAKIVLLTDFSSDSQALRASAACGASGYIDKNVSWDTMLVSVKAVLQGQLVFPRRLREYIGGVAEALASQGKAVPKQDNGNACAAESGTDSGEDSRPEPHGRRDEGVVRGLGQGHNGHTATLGRPIEDWRGTTPLSVIEGNPSSARGSQDVKLTDRESEILKLVARGEANKVIAMDLAISEATVKAHLKNLLRKLGLSNRTQAAIWAVENMPTIPGSLQRRSGRLVS